MENEISMSGLYHALRSGYKYFYAPIPKGVEAGNLHSTANRAGAELRKELKVGQRIILNPEDNTYTKILLIEVLGNLPEDEEKKARLEEKRRDKLDKISKIKKLRREGLTYKEIAQKMGYKAGDTIIKILKEESKWLKDE